MRQAGRYLSEYREVRKRKGGFLEMCYDSDAAAEVSVQPFDFFGMDGVIMFSDILTPLIPMGMNIEFSPGPIVHNPISARSEIDRLRNYDPSEGVPFVGAILGKIKKYLNGRAPVIGFAGAPFTLGVYMVGKEKSETAMGMKRLIYGDPDSYGTLMEKLTQMTINYLNYQIASGAEVIQLFDTWAGNLSKAEFNEYVLPYVSRIFANLNRKGVPVIYFVNGGSHLLESMNLCGADTIGIDWRTDIEVARSVINPEFGLQGNLDPAMLFAGQYMLEEKVCNILEFFSNKKGFIFNLGHGIHKETPRENVKFVVDLVHGFDVRQ